MSVARPVFRDTRLFLSRRVRGRVFLLRPNDLTNQILLYVVAVMAEQYEIGIHAITVMSNHWHLCVSDPMGNIVDFQRDCHSFIARGLNAPYGDFEALWSSSQSSKVTCVEASDLVGKIAYTMANPVEAGLVCYGKSWPGVRHAWPRKDRKVNKPAKFFRGKEKGGKWPATATFRLARPPGYDELADDELAVVIDEAIEAREKAYREKHKREGHRFMGRKAVLAQSRHARPSSYEPRFGISPQVACKDKWKRIERLAANTRWRNDYKAALKAWVSGVREVVFPHGTYKMRIEHKVNCAPAPT